jgi:hypothetical protein
MELDSGGGAAAFSWMRERPGSQSRAGGRLLLVRSGLSWSTLKKNESPVKRRFSECAEEARTRRRTLRSLLGSGSAERRTYEVGGLIVRSNFVSLFWIR